VSHRPGTRRCGLAFKSIFDECVKEEYDEQRSVHIYECVLGGWDKNDESMCLFSTTECFCSVSAHHTEKYI